MTVKDFQFEKWLHHVFMALKVFGIAILKNAGEQPLLKVTYHIIFTINELELPWVPNFIALEIYFIFESKFSWNEGIDTSLISNVRYLAVILIFLVVTARYLVVSAGYCSLPGGYWWLLLVAGGCCSLPLVTARSYF